MWGTEFGTAKLCKELQLLKAAFSMWVTDSGMVKLAKELLKGPLLNVARRGCATLEGIVRNAWHRGARCAFGSPKSCSFALEVQRLYFDQLK